MYMSTCNVHVHEKALFLVLEIDLRIRKLESREKAAELEEGN